YSYRRAAAAAALTVALTCTPTASALDDAGYLRVADSLQPAIESKWDDDAGRYRTAGGGVETTTNANMLVVHAVAALRDHHGPSRQDRRARLLVRSLLASPPYTATLPPPLNTGSQWHAPGWVSSMTTLRSRQHVMVRREVGDGPGFARTTPPPT